MHEKSPGRYTRLLDAQGQNWPQVAAEDIGITVTDLEDALSVDLKASTSNRSTTSQKAQRIATLARVLDQILPRCGSAAEAWKWVTTAPIPSLGDRTAIALIREGQGHAVVKHLNRLDAGGYA